MEVSVITDLQGKTPVEIRYNEVGMVFKLSDGTFFTFYHEQDCCESVTIEDVVGDVGDLVGYPLEVVEERSESGDSDDYECYTWTYYTFRGIGGTVDVRWYGSSNGYYSESVDCGFYDPDNSWGDMKIVVEELFPEVKNA